ncbi:hypothetical protein PoB_000108300 [Plakobranchus ocellatus]|uniref:Uncharacterized protein n=1 Tax=Plakobranchus ocellatus TaxID=259542 RepID=A0AAV3XWD2_9GAST|nr:hypothetical protein PoB_000108300 [Plakobranchus ocellatus]
MALAPTPNMATAATIAITAIAQRTTPKSNSDTNNTTKINSDSNNNSNINSSNTKITATATLTAIPKRTPTATVTPTA